MKQAGEHPISDTGAMAYAWALREINGTCRVKWTGKVVQSCGAGDIE